MLSPTHGAQLRVSTGLVDSLEWPTLTSFHFVDRPRPKSSLRIPQSGRSFSFRPGGAGLTIGESDGAQKKIHPGSPLWDTRPFGTFFAAIW